MNEKFSSNEIINDIYNNLDDFGKDFLDKIV